MQERGKDFFAAIQMGRGDYRGEGSAGRRKDRIPFPPEKGECRSASAVR